MALVLRVLGFLGSAAARGPSTYYRSGAQVRFF
jgi:hypothetical protein